MLEGEIKVVWDCFQHIKGKTHFTIAIILPKSKLSLQLCCKTIGEDLIQSFIFLETNVQIRIRKEGYCECVVSNILSFMLTIDRINCPCVNILNTPNHIYNLDWITKINPTHTHPSSLLSGCMCKACSPEIIGDMEKYLC